MTKSDKFMPFLDALLSNLRTVNDTYKLQIKAHGMVEQEISLSQPMPN